MFIGSEEKVLLDVREKQDHIATTVGNNSHLIESKRSGLRSYCTGTEGVTT